MAIRIHTTHIWTKVFVPIIWITRLAAIGVVISILEAILPDNGFAVVVYIIACIGTIVLHAMFIEQWYHQFQTWLYIRINLGTKISLSEAKCFLLLFAPSELGSWYPMTGIREIPKEYRREALYQSARKIYKELGYVFISEAYNNANQRKKSDSSNERKTGLPSGFSCLVALLCKLAKSDGVISQEEIDVIDDFFNNILNLSSDEREEAVDIFKQSKTTDIPFEVYAREFYNYHSDNSDLLELVVILLAKIACADGDLSSEEEILIYQAISIFDVDESIYEKYKENYSPKTSVNEKHKHYANVLGLEDDYTPSVIKSAYRKLAFKYHPDKVSHLGDKIREVAEMEMKKINEAYVYFQKKYDII